MKYWAIVAAAGAGRRFSSTLKKQYLVYDGQFIFALGLLTLLENSLIQGVVVTTQDIPKYPIQAYENWLLLKEKYRSRLILTSGADERVWSVKAGLTALLAQRFWAVEQHDFVLVHDGVRPCLHQQDLSSLLAQVQSLYESEKYRVGGDSFGVMLGRPVTDTLKKVSDGMIQAHVDRTSVWQAQTPQIFQIGALEGQLRRSYADQAQVVPTDECQIMAQAGVAIHVVQAQHPNPKLTFADDVPLIMQLLQDRHAPT